MEAQQSIKQDIPDLSMSAILSKTGFKLIETRGRVKVFEAWSKNETARVRISADDLLGLWFDHFSKTGGQPIAFIKHWWKLNEGEAAEKLRSLSLTPATGKRKRINGSIKIPNYIIEDIKDIGTNKEITDFLAEKEILQPALSCLREVYYHFTDFKGITKKFFAAGFLNEKFGWQVVSRNYKGCIGKEGIILIKFDADLLAVFVDLYSYLLWKKTNPFASHSVLILNSLILVGEGISAAKCYSKIDLFLPETANGCREYQAFTQALPHARTYFHLLQEM